MLSLSLFQKQAYFFSLCVPLDDHAKFRESGCGSRLDRKAKPVRYCREIAEKKYNPER